MNGGKEHGVKLKKRRRVREVIKRLWGTRMNRAQKGTWQSSTWTGTMRVKQWHTVGRKNSIYQDEKRQYGKEARQKVLFWELERKAATASLITFGDLDFSELLRSKNMFPLVSEVVSLLTTPQVLQMRGGADTHEKMGHEQDVFPNPQAMCYNFQLSAHCQVCRHQLLHMCCTATGTVEWAKKKKKKKDKQQLVDKAQMHVCSYKFKPLPFYAHDYSAIFQ